MGLLSSRWALMREVAVSIRGCNLTFQEREPIDPKGARAEHAAYRLALERWGLTVEVLPPLPDSADGCFVEDTAVVFPEIAVLCRIIPNRQAEVATMAERLSRFEGLRIATMDGAARAEGGDVLVMGKDVFVGISSRTNREGYDFLGSVLEPFAYRVQGIEVRGALHLKTACTRLDEHTLLAATEHLGSGKEALERYRVIEVSPLGEGANVVAVGGLGGVLFVAAECPGLQETLHRYDYSCEPLPLTEIRKAEGGLSCLAILSPFA